MIHSSKSTIDFLNVCFHVLTIPSVILENCVAFVVVRYVGDSYLGLKLFLKGVQTDEPSQGHNVCGCAAV